MHKCKRFNSGEEEEEEKQGFPKIRPVRIIHMNCDCEWMRVALIYIWPGMPG